MSEPIQSYPGQPYPAPAPNSNLKTAIGGGLLAALLVSNIYLLMQVHDMKADNIKSRDSVQAEIADLKENSTVASATSRKHLQQLNEDLESTRRQANSAASQAKREALTFAEQKTKQLEQQQQEASAKLSGDISEVKQSATTANAKIADVSGDVRNVKTQVESTKSELDRTISDLKRVTGDLGVTSGYVATNGKELAALKALGERNIFEFRLSKSKQPQRVGDVSLTLKKADAKHNRFTLDIVADDKLTEKKDKTLNEPVQFYTSKAHQPYEIVVNQVNKDQIVGYLSTPKVQSARN